MAKKINTFGATVKTLLLKGYSQSWIARKLKVKRQRVNYWATHPLKTEQTKRRKLPDTYIQKIIELAKDKTTSSMSSYRIMKYINLKLAKDKMNMKISKATICRILNKEYGKPRKIKKVFFLNKKQKDDRVKFCKMILEKGIKGDQIFFSDETKIEMGAYVNDHIRLSKDSKEKLKKGDEDAFDLINRPQKKFELSLMVAGGICSKGLSDLIILEGPENEFSYAQILHYYKNSFNKFQKKGLYFEQDGATPHTSIANQALIKKLFGEASFIQNPPNSPDIAYPIETLWGYIKPRIKLRVPKNLEELKQIAIEEWRLIPKERIKNCGLNFIRRIKKIIEIGGGRLEEFHLREIRRDAKNEGEKNEKDELDNIEDNHEEQDDEQIINSSEESLENIEEPKIKYSYNDQRLGIIKKKEIANLRKQINVIREKYKNEEKMLEIKELEELMKRNDSKKNSKGKRKSKIMRINKKKNAKKQKKKLKEEKKVNIKEIQNNIKEIEKMDIIGYLNHLREKDNKKNKKSPNDYENNDDQSTIDEAISTIQKIQNLEDNIKYDLEF